MSVGIAILAAGSSSRMGEPKQLLRLGGETLLDKSVAAAINSRCSPIVLTLGANYREILHKTELSKAVTVVINEQWQEGLSTSVRLAVEKATSLDPELAAIILMLCDQPFVTSSSINQLIDAQESSGKLIVTSHFGGVFGPPALFHRSLFGELTNISGDTGAKLIVQKHLDQSTFVEFPPGSIDIDCPADLSAAEALLAGSSVN